MSYTNYDAENGIIGAEENNWRDGNLEVASPDYFNMFQGIYVLKKFENIGKLPEYIKLNGKKCRRFLEIFYFHEKLSQLTISQTAALCNLRLQFLQNIAAVEYNKYVICHLIKKAFNTDFDSGNGKPKVLDYGIGSGISSECFELLGLKKQHELTGTDISSEALRICDQKGIKTFHWWDRKNMSNQQFDAIISSFVFDFSIKFYEVKGLYQLLKPGGRLVLNLYKDDLHNYQYVLNNLKRTDFAVKSQIVEVPREQFGIKHKIEKVIVATK